MLRSARCCALLLLVGLHQACAAVAPSADPTAEAAIARPQDEGPAQEARPASLAEREEELAMSLANPVASLTSLPLQWNYDADIGPGDEGERQVLNVQPVVPFNDWNADQWSVPVNAVVSKVFGVGGQLLSTNVGVRYWAESPDAGPEGFGLRFVLVFLFPKG